MDWVTDDNAALLTDLYELTMAASYFAHGLEEPATFDLFVRSLPKERLFLISCGLDEVLDYLESLHFTDEAVAYLDTLGLFDAGFLDRLRTFRFTGDVWAMPEGEAVFANEPILEITAPLIEAQIVETFLLNCVGFQTMVASKAARLAIACGTRAFVDFSPRRDHGADAALRAARASYVGGASATSNVLAGKVYGIPVTGTMAHSYVMRFEDEAEAFRTFARDFPTNATFLIDTYDTEESARLVAGVARDLEPEGVRPEGVRLDSGDLAKLATSVRHILDTAGLDDAHIFASSDLDEYRIADILRQGAPVDAFGVGTQLGTSGDAPHLGVVYKLVEDITGPKIKLSPGKMTLPGRKQVYRDMRNGTYERDVIARFNEPVDAGERILQEAMRAGRRLAPSVPLPELRERCETTLERLPPRLHSLEPGEPSYEVQVSPGLQELVASARAAHASST